MDCALKQSIERELSRVTASKCGFNRLSHRFVCACASVIKIYNYFYRFGCGNIVSSMGLIILLFRYSFFSVILVYNVNENVSFGICYLQFMAIHINSLFALPFQQYQKFKFDYTA